MGLVSFDEDDDHLVTERYSQGRGTVLRGDHFELTRIRFARGEGATRHAHPQDQAVYVLSGRLRVTLAHETYEVGPGQASFAPANVEHAVEALEDVVALSVKAPLGNQDYGATGRLR